MSRFDGIAAAVELHAKGDLRFGQLVRASLPNAEQWEEELWLVEDEALAEMIVKKAESAIFFSGVPTHNKRPDDRFRLVMEAMETHSGGGLRLGQLLLLAVRKAGLADQAVLLKEDLELARLIEALPGRL